jgi:hypothetical protein
VVKDTDLISKTMSALSFLQPNKVQSQFAVQQDQQQQQQLGAEEWEGDEKQQQDAGHHAKERPKKLPRKRQDATCVSDFYK